MKAVNKTCVKTVMKQNKTLVLLAAMAWSMTGCIQTDSTVVTPDVSSLTPVVEIQPPQNNQTESLPSNENQTQNNTGGSHNDNSGSSYLEGFEILNINSAGRTKDGFVDLHMITLDRNQMKVSFDPSCSSGTWETWEENKTYQIPPNLLNSRVRVSVQFKDFDNGVKDCNVISFTHDNQGPSIIFKKYPAATILPGTDVEIQAEVTDDYGQPKNVKCIFQGVPQNCYAGLNDVKISQLPVGQYKFEVTAEDDLGNVSSSAVLWAVEVATLSVEQKVTVNDYKKVDILFVIDNSGSMEYEQKNMAKRTANFLSVLRGLDYNIAITTTDPVHKTLGDGRLVQLTNGGGKYLITSSMPEAEAQTLLSNTLQRSEQGSGSEQGIRAAYRLVERYKANEATPKSFFRDGAQFSVVLISDEDESDNTEKNDPLKLVQLISSTFNSQKRFNYHSIITRPGDTACRSTYGYAYGERYKTMSELTGGLIGDVCASDYASQVQDAAEGIRNLLKTITLNCVPLVDRGITIKREGVIVTNTYQVEGVNLKFNQELEPGSYQIDYKCLK